MHLKNFFFFSSPVTLFKTDNGRLAASFQLLSLSILIQGGLLEHGMKNSELYIVTESGDRFKIIPDLSTEPVKWFLYKEGNPRFLLTNDVMTSEILEVGKAPNSFWNGGGYTVIDHIKQMVMVTNLTLKPAHLSQLSESGLLKEFKI